MNLINKYKLYYDLKLDWRILSTLIICLIKIRKIVKYQKEEHQV